MDNCDICDSESDFKCCDHCKCKCCEQCFPQHQNNGACKLIQTYIAADSCRMTCHSQCRKRLISFCATCNYLVCKKCKVDHSTHNVMDIKEASEEIKINTLDGVLKEIACKISECNKYYNYNTKIISITTETSVSTTIPISRNLGELPKGVSYYCKMFTSIRNNIETLKTIASNRTFLAIWENAFEDVKRNINSYEKCKVQRDGIENPSSSREDIIDGIVQGMDNMCINGNKPSKEEKKKDRKRSEKLQRQIEDLKTDLKEHHENLRALSEEKEERDMHIKKLQETNRDQVQNISQLKTTKKSMEQKENDMKEMQHRYEVDVEQKQLEIASLKQNLYESSKSMEQKEQTMSDMQQKYEADVKQKNLAITSLKQQLNESLNSMEQKENDMKEMQHRYEVDVEQKQLEIASLKQNLYESSKSMEQKEQTMSDMQQKYEADVKQKNLAITSLKQQLNESLNRLQNVEQEKAEFCKESEKGHEEELRKTIMDNENSIHRMITEIDEYRLSMEQKEKDMLNMQQRYEADVEQKNSEITYLNQQLGEISKREKNANTMLTTVNSELSSRCNQVSEMENHIRLLKSEKDNLQTRLSCFAGDTLTKGNPAITDLSDPNRPMKIGERYGELYDNDWTDAMEKVETIKQNFPDKDDSEIEEIMIKYLHRILKCCYNECFKMVKWQIQQVVVAFGLNTSEDISLVNLVDSVTGLKELMAFRYKNAEQFAKRVVVNKAFCNTFFDGWNYNCKNEAVMGELISSTFYEKCIELCWYMVIQDPAMYLDEDISPGTVIDKNAYREFTKKGEKVEFVVWPALYLHKDGPLLYKGVVQVTSGNQGIDGNIYV